MAVVTDKEQDMEKSERAARRSDVLAVAGLIRFLAGMVLTAGLGCLLLGGIAYYRDKQVRNAMGRAMARVTEEYVHGGAYYVTYEADGAVHEGLLGYDGTLAVGSELPILYERDLYGHVRTDTLADGPVKLLTWGLGAIGLGVLSLLGQAFLKARDENPWDDDLNT